MHLLQSQLFEDFFFPFKVQYIFGFLAFHGEEFTTASPSDSALTFHLTESFISFWPKISIDLCCCQLCNSCAIQENHSGLRRLRDFIKSEKKKKAGWEFFSSQSPLNNSLQYWWRGIWWNSGFTPLQDLIKEFYFYEEEEAIEMETCSLHCGIGWGWGKKRSSFWHQAPVSEGGAFSPKVD